MNNFKIESKWCLWYHSITDNSWKKDSYKKIININNLLDYHFLKNNFERQHLQNGMFFIMRDCIFPTWEDPENRLGGSISLNLYSYNNGVQIIRTHDVFDTFQSIYCTEEVDIIGS